jgi:cobalt/nickel transport system permease protein
MHIPEGALGSSAAGMAVLGAGVLAAGVGTALGLGRMDYQRVPRVAMLSAAFFVASLLSVPVGPTYIHPLLNGLMGLVLGWAAFPALLVALLLQAVFFQYGGLTTLGLNTVNMALPAVACY